MVTTLPLSGKFAQRLRITPVTSAGRTDSGGRETPHPVREKRSGAGRRPRGHLASPTCDSPCRAGRCAATDGRNSDGHVDTAAPPGDRFRHAACRAAYPWDRLQRTDGPDHRPGIHRAAHRNLCDGAPRVSGRSAARRPRLPAGIALPPDAAETALLPTFRIGVAESPLFSPDTHTGGIGLRSRNCCASRDTCGLDLAVP